MRKTGKNSPKTSSCANTAATQALSKSPEHGQIKAKSRLVPGLTLVATPIGNLGDIATRALAAFAEADLVLCEDTRVSKKLLGAYGMSVRLASYHDHNAERIRPRILSRLRRGDRIVLISDAGTPAIADPGYKLVSACHDEQIAVSTIPGPTALIAALTISGLPTDRFYFGGFLPAKAGARRAALEALKSLVSTLVHYETPRRLAATLADAAEILPGRSAVVGRELTKLHEEVRRGTLAELQAHYAAAGPCRGEVVLLIGPPAKPDPAMTETAIDDALTAALDCGTLRDAVQSVARATGVARNQVYRRALRLVDKVSGDV